MPFIPVPNGVKIVMNITKANQKCANVFYVTVSATVTDTLLDTIGAAVKSWWVANVLPSMTPDVTLNSITVTDVSVAGGLGIEYTTGLPITGTNSGGILPNNVTLAVKLTTGFAGRSNRGRQYLIGLPANDLTSDGQHISTATASAIKGWYDSLISDMVTAGAVLVIASLYHGVDSLHKPIPRTTGVTHPVAGVSVDTTMDSQRRRLPGRGQ
jgi:hypothetical protein